MQLFGLEKVRFFGVVAGLVLAVPAASAAERGCEATAFLVASSSELAPAQARKLGRSGDTQTEALALAGTQPSLEAHTARHERNLRAVLHKTTSLGTGESGYALAERRERRSGGPSDGIVC